MVASAAVQIKGLQLGICITFCLVIFSALTRFILDANDRTRCESMLDDGHWLDGDSYKQWQPTGCMIHTYKADDVATCLNHSHILYIGDSIARQQFFSFAKLIHQDIETDGEKHIDRRYEFADKGLTFEFWWDPYLNNTRTLQYLQQPAAAAIARDHRPSLLVVGTGTWHMRYLEPTVYMEEWQTGINHVLNAVQRSSQVADAVIVSPVEVPQFDRLSSNRSSTITLEKVKAMNDYLTTQQRNINNPRTPFAVPFAWNKVITSSHNVTQDGLHYGPAVTDAQVQLALNYRCNDARPKHFPYSATCCFHYPKSRWYQNIFFILFLVLVPAAFYLGDTGLFKLIPSENVLNALFIFGLGVIYMYFGDRTQLFGKMNKHFDESTFTILMVLTVMVAGLATLKTTKKEGVDLGFLNRDQTDEWKGWMQVIILVYHFLGASGISGIYNAVRILVAAYLFQTGYGHFSFFYKKDDFSLARALNVMVRLNLLTFVLQYLMDTDYLSYYFTPLVSFWFGVIYLTMYIGHSNNKNVIFMCAKIAIAALVTTVLTSTPGIMEFCFDILRFLFNIQWNATEWRFRLSLDGFIVYAGMITAFAYIKCMENKWVDHPSFGKFKMGILTASSLAMLWYFWFELTREDKYAYNVAQPYVSWIPILAFVFLRNATVRLRNTSSRFFIFIGKISLETFIGQFHMWLAGDTKGLLLVIPYNNWVIQSAVGWYTNLLVSTTLFIFVSYHLSDTTSTLTQWICKDLLMGKITQQRNITTTRHEYQSVPLLPTSSTAVTANGQGTEGDGQLLNNVDGNNNGSTGGRDNSRSSLENVATMNVDDEEAGTPFPEYSLCYRIISDPRFKVLAFLVGVGILNRLS